VTGPARARPVSHRRRASRWMVAGIVLFVPVTVAVFAARPRPSAYVPGREAANSAEITRSLERNLPPGKGGPPSSSDGPAGVAFHEGAAEAGLAFEHFHGRRSSQLPEDMGSGLAWGDYDGDGHTDLFVVNESGPLTLSADEVARSAAHARLFHNRGDGTFEDVTEAAGVAVRGLGMGAAWGDYDGDLDLDLFVTRYGTNLLFRNEGGGRFRDVSARTGVGLPRGFWTGISLADYDGDGDLDAYICGYVRYRWDAGQAGRTSRQFKAVVPYTLNPSSYAPERNLLLRNEGGVFVDAAAAAGVDNRSGRSLSASWCDFDGDGWPDLYVANDVSDNALFLNLGGGKFRDISHPAWVADPRGAMGLGIGDWENDGDFDIFITHWIAQENALYADESRSMKPTAEAPLRFVDQADVFGLGQIALDVIGWGTGFFDFDNDGWLDVYAVNGSTFQDEGDPTRLVPMRSFLFWNSEGHGFFEIGARAGEPFTAPAVGRGAAVADYDGDGDLDVGIVVHGGPLRLARNDGGNRKGWVRLVLRGLPPDEVPRGDRHARRSTTFATGARVLLKAGGLSQMRMVGGQSSFLGQEPPGEVFFGTGDAARVDRLEVRWPSGRVESFADLPVRSTVRIREGGQPQVAADGR
jgi:enediyne biosynthesis protein E4